MAYLFFLMTGPDQLNAINTRDKKIDTFKIQTKLLF